MIRIRPMTEADVPLGMHLGQQAGWNQLAADWVRMLHLEPAGCFVAEADGTPAGTTCTCRFGPVAWVAMVLVEASRRGQGIATALMLRALDYLDEQGATTIRLDATPLGEPVYRKLGFVDEYTLERFAGVLPSGDGPEPMPENRVQPATKEWLPRVAEFDRAITGTDRRLLLLRLAEEYPDEVRILTREDQQQGYLMSRPGRLAWYLGPCLASPEAGGSLLDDASRRHAGQRVFLDIPEVNAAARNWASLQGLTAQRKLLRMVRGERIHDDPNRIWTSSGPEKG